MRYDELTGAGILTGGAQEFTPLATDDSPDNLHQLTVQLKCLIQEKESRDHSQLYSWPIANAG